VAAAVKVLIRGGNEVRGYEVPPRFQRLIGPQRPPFLFLHFSTAVSYDVRLGIEEGMGRHAFPKQLLEVMMSLSLTGFFLRND
jgi:hypothetical protein